MYTVCVPHAHRSQEKALESLGPAEGSHEWCLCGKFSLGVLEQKHSLPRAEPSLESLDSVLKSCLSMRGKKIISSCHGTYCCLHIL